MSNRTLKIIDLLKSKGMLFPSNSNEVIEFEKTVSIDEVKSSDIENPVDIIHKGKQNLDKVTLKTNIALNNVEVQNLAVAAREGKTISDEIRKKMNEDRVNEEKK